MGKYVFDKEHKINRENVEIGDEVINVHGTKSVVVGFQKNTGKIILCFANTETKLPTFSVYDELYDFYVKTGNSYGYIKDIFKE